MTPERPRPRRVVFTQYSNPGAYPPVLNAAALLAERGAEVSLVGVRGGSTEALTVPAGLGMQEHLLESQPPGWRQKVNYLRWLGLTLLTCWRRRPCVLYVSDFYAAPAGVLAHAAGIPVLFHEHDAPPPPSWGSSRWLKVLLAARARLGRVAVACIAPGEERRARLVSETNATVPAYSVMNCPRLAEVPPVIGDVRAEGLVLHYHGSLDESRLPLEVVDAIALLPPNTILQVVGYVVPGSVGYFDRLDERAVALGVRSRVRVLDPVPRTQLFDLCRRASVGLMLLDPDPTDPNTQSMAGASNKIFDYLACGLPVVVSSAPGLAKMVVGAGVGVECGGLSGRTIADAIGPLLEVATRREMGSRGLQLVLEQWNYEAQFEPVLRLIERAFSKA